MSASDEVQVEVREQVRTIALNRPQVKNALTKDVCVRLAAAFREAATDAATRAVIFTGRGGSFCSGADLKAAMTDPAVTSSTPEQNIAVFHEVVRAIVQCPRPVVALVDGPAAGFGADLALACDLRVATRTAYFQWKFVRIGLVPDGGGTFWLPRMVGLARAAELTMIGDRLEAEEAHRLGVVNRLVAPAEGESAAQELAGKLAKGPPLALRLIKESLLKNLDGDVDAALDQEKRAQAQCLVSPDLFEGVAAFFEKREPRFRGE
jgi:2-(1,2-epoxy-1,2-dihydrophenyl)acetyl-CoA isomerase